MNKKVIIPIFILLALVQLYIPLDMILGRERTIEKGKEFRLRVRPVDPHDPFIGKYVRLSFMNDRFKVEPNDTLWKSGQIVYATLGTNPDGSSYMKSVYHEAPDEDHFIEAHVWWFDKSDLELNIEYPFERYYMEESKAKPAEDLYRESVRSDSLTAHAVISVFRGNTVLTGLEINDIPIEVLAAERRDAE